MSARVLFTLLFTVSLTALAVPGFAQSKIPGAPSNAPPHTDVTSNAEGKADQIGALFENVELYANFARQQDIDSHLTQYLADIGAKPTAGEIHVFYVQALSRDNGTIELQDFQYLANGKSVEDALRESFAVEHSPGTEDRGLGPQLVGLYVTATPEDGKFAIRGGALSKDFYEKVRKEGLELHDQRAKALAEANRVEAIRQKRFATHHAGDPEAHRQLNVAHSSPPPRPGPQVSPPGPPDAKPPDVRVYQPPTKSSPQATANPVGPLPMQSLPAAHPPVKFNQPPPPAQAPPSQGPMMNRQP